MNNGMEAGHNIWLIGNHSTLDQQSVLDYWYNSDTLGSPNLKLDSFL